MGKGAGRKGRIVQVSPELPQSECGAITTPEMTRKHPATPNTQGPVHPRHRESGTWVLGWALRDAGEGGSPHPLALTQPGAGAHFLLETLSCHQRWLRLQQGRED